jgi:hypothetical protein
VCAVEPEPPDAPLSRLRDVTDGSTATSSEGDPSVNIGDGFHSITVITGSAALIVPVPIRMTLRDSLGGSVPIQRRLKHQERKLRPALSTSLRLQSLLPLELDLCLGLPSARLAVSSEALVVELPPQGVSGVDPSVAAEVPEGVPYDQAGEASGGVPPL